MPSATTRFRRLTGAFGTGLLLLTGRPFLAAADPDQLRPIPSPEPGWPQWRGPNRDGQCRETSLMQQWPEGGPPLLWQADGLERGYSAPIITAGHIYLTGDAGDELRVFALDRDGRRLWQSKNGRSWKGPYPGARSSCSYSEGRLYHLNAHGRLACLSAADGSELWSVDVLERFAGRNITWALSENLLVDGDRVIVTPGGAKALMAALDKKTGATVWTSEPLRLGKLDDPAHVRVAEPAGELDSAGYGSPLLLECGGRRLIVSCSLRHLFGVDADTGRLVWTRPFPTRYLVVPATPLLVGDGVFVTAPDTEYGGLYRLRFSAGRWQVERAWATELDTCHGGWICWNGVIYGACYREGKGWAGVEARTGVICCRTKELAKGSVLYADDRLYCLGEDGEMALVKPTAQQFEFVGRFRLTPGRVHDAWTHPVILGGRLYLRYQERLFCYDVRARQDGK
jgi:outer membrane protein assembly factor BamB